MSFWHRRKVLAEMANTDPGEDVDPRPVEIPLELQAPESLESRMRQMIRQEMSQAASEAGYGTFTEEDDFGEDDAEELPPLPYNVPEDDFLDMVPFDTETIDGPAVEENEPEEGQPIVPAEQKAETSDVSGAPT